MNNPIDIVEYYTRLKNKLDYAEQQERISSRKYIKSNKRSDRDIALEYSEKVRTLKECIELLNVQDDDQ